MNIQKSFKHIADQKEGVLYLVPTPIGNLQDMTFRAIETLKQVDYIASEDTRVTQKLLNYYSITTPQISFHQHNQKDRLPQLMALLQEGNHIAQVSDAGMPSISDPGYELVQCCLQKDISVISLPGASAGITALIASGVAPQPFTFYGFFPKKLKEQQSLLAEIQTNTKTAIFYESPYRMLQTVEICLNCLGSDWPIVICRELTKIHEEYIRGTTQEVYDYLQDHTLKGECVLMISGAGDQKIIQEIAPDQIKVYIDDLIRESSFNSKEAIKYVAKKYGLKKNYVYAIYHELNQEDKG